MSTLLQRDSVRSVLRLATLAAVLLAGGCNGRDANQPAAVREIRMGDAGLLVAFDQPVDLMRIIVLDEQGSLVQELPVAGRRSVYEVPFRGEAKRAYRIELHLADRMLVRRLEMPPAPSPLRAVVEVPPGQHAIEMGSTGSARVLVTADGVMAFGLFVENRRQVGARYRWRLELSEGVTIASDDARLIANDEGKLSATGELDLESDYHQVLANLRVAAGARDPWMRCRFSQSSGPEMGEIESSLTIELRSASAAESAAMIEIQDVVFPADASNRPRAEQLTDTVVLANPFWSRIRRIFRSSDTLINYYEPYGSQAVWLRNRSDLALNLLIQSEVAGAEEDALAEFSPPAWSSPSGSPTAEHLIRLAPKEVAAVRIPLFVRPEAVAGAYQRRFRVYLVGADKPLVEFVRPLSVIRSDPLVSVVAVAAIGLSLVAWIALALFGRRMVAGIGTEGLVTIALVAGLHFVVSYAFRLGGNLLAGLIGPFYVFVAGIGDEGLASLLMAAAVTLVPRAGAFTLSSLTVFLLNALFTGQLGIADVLFVTVSSVLGEACLAAVGATTTPWLRRPAPHASVSAVLRIAVALGVANAATLCTQFCLTQVLHRLFFAPWYVAAVSLIPGLVYGGIGAGWGTVLGYRLRRTSR